MFPLVVYEFILFLLGTGFIIGIGLGFILFNKELKVKLMRVITKKNYGLVYFVSKGKTVFETIANLSNSLFRYRDRIFYFIGGTIYVLKPKVVKGVDMSSLNRKKMSEPEIQKYIIKKIEIDAKNMKQTLIGIPVIFFDYDDMAPLNIVKGEPDTKFRDSKFVASILDNEIEIERRKAMNADKKKMNREFMFTMIAIGLIGILVAAQFMMLSNMNKKINMIGSALFPAPQQPVTHPVHKTPSTPPQNSSQVPKQNGTLPSGR